MTPDHCHACGTPCIGSTLCRRCDDDLAAMKRQQQLAREGREAERHGLPVIYVHGRPYVAPD